MLPKIKIPWSVAVLPEAEVWVLFNLSEMVDLAISLIPIKMRPSTALLEFRWLDFMGRVEALRVSPLTPVYKLELTPWNHAGLAAAGAGSDIVTLTNCDLFGKSCTTLKIDNEKKSLLISQELKDTNEKKGGFLSSFIGKKEK